MPYLRCPNCGQLAHIASEGPAAIGCPRCRALHKDVELLPVEQSLQQVEAPAVEVKDEQ